MLHSLVEQKIKRLLLSPCTRKPPSGGFFVGAPLPQRRAKWTERWTIDKRGLLAACVCVHVMTWPDV